MGGYHADPGHRVNTKTPGHADLTLDPHGAGAQELIAAMDATPDPPMFALAPFSACGTTMRPLIPLHRPPFLRVPFAVQPAPRFRLGPVSFQRVLHVHLSRRECQFGRGEFAARPQNVNQLLNLRTFSREMVVEFFRPRHGIHVIAVEAESNGNFNGGVGNHSLISKSP